jgi:hypothetical protein
MKVRIILQPENSTATEGPVIPTIHMFTFLQRKDARCYLSIWPIRWLKISTAETLVLLIFTILAQIMINFL